MIETIGNGPGHLLTGGVAAKSAVHCPGRHILFIHSIEYFVQDILRQAEGLAVIVVETAPEILQVQPGKLPVQSRPPGLPVLRIVRPLKDIPAALGNGSRHILQQIFPFVYPGRAQTAETAAHGFINAINTVLWSYVLIVVLVGIGIWFTLRTKFVQVRMLPEMLRLLTEGMGSKTVDKQISTFQAFCVSTASRVGVGNIAGVAIAIVTGGPGAVFWMWAIAFIGCATGFVESTLAQIYKLPRGNGTFHGGPAYYIQNALKKPGVAKLFALLISVTFGLIYNSVQANTIALSVETAFGLGHMTTAIILCVLTALVIFGGMPPLAEEGSPD